jgi:hypothetical protein
MASTAMQVGAAVGLAVLVAIADPAQAGASLAGGLRTATYVAAAGIALGALVSLGLPRPPAARARHAAASSRA